jgi:type IV secretion system protein VirB10
MSQKQEDSKREVRSAGFANSSLLEEELYAAASKTTSLAVPAEPSPDVPAVEPQTKIQVVVVRPKTPAKKRPRPLTNSERTLAAKYREMKNSAVLSKSGIDFTEKSANAAGAQRTETSDFALPDRTPQYGLPAEAIRALTQGTQRDANGQTRKLDFLLKDSAGRTPQGYSENTRMPQLARFELKAGTVIPGLLITGVNSDLPGTVIGQVSENVYDTASGNFLLIPQGARLLGVYDSNITYGQKRLGIVWNRLIFPDGSSLNIAGSPGADLAGYSGVKGQVDNHYGQLLSAALFTSVFAGAADIATGGQNSSNDSDKTHLSQMKKITNELFFL